MGDCFLLWANTFKEMPNILCINFDKNWFGLHFGRFFYKLIWSPWSNCCRKVSRDIVRHRATSCDIARHRETSREIVQHRATSRDIARHRATQKSRWIGREQNRCQCLLSAACTQSIKLDAQNCWPAACEHHSRWSHHCAEDTISVWAV
jgi:hypothetical protein